MGKSKWLWIALLSLLGVAAVSGAQAQDRSQVRRREPSAELHRATVAKARAPDSKRHRTGKLEQADSRSRHHPITKAKPMNAWQKNADLGRKHR